MASTGCDFVGNGFTYDALLREQSVCALVSNISYHETSMEKARKGGLYQSYM